MNCRPQPQQDQAAIPRVCIGTTANALYIIAKPRDLVVTLRELALSYDRLADLVHRTTN